jgi:hypothetical protein
LSGGSTRFWKNRVANLLQGGPPPATFNYARDMLKFSARTLSNRFPQADFKGSILTRNPESACQDESLRSLSGLLSRLQQIRDTLESIWALSNSIVHAQALHCSSKEDLSVVIGLSIFNGLV